MTRWSSHFGFFEAWHRAIDEDSDDKNALDDRVRAEQLTQISSDLLATERLECQLVEAAKAVDTVLDFREDAPPRAPECRIDRDAAAPMITTVVRAAPALVPAAVLWLAAMKASAPAYASG
jgi:hypothetical protein